MLSWLRWFWRRSRGLARAEEVGREIDEELAFHIDMRTEENIRRGMSPAEARRDAERRFGSRTRIKERGYEVRGGGWLETVWQDVRFGARLLAKRPGFTAAAALSLALGVGACTAIFSVVDAVLLRPLPYPGADRLVELREVSDKGALMPFTEPNYVDARARNRTLAALAQYRTVPATVAGGSEPARARVSMVSGEFFDVMGTRPHLGRTFLPGEDRAGGQFVAVVSYGFWQKLLGARTDLEAAPLNVFDHSFTVVGVMPPEFRFPFNSEVWIPREVFPAQTSRTAHNWSVVARLRDGATVGEAVSDLDAVGRQIKAEFGDGVDAAALTAVPLQEYMVGHVRAALLILLGAVALLLLIACANVGNMVLAQATARRREIAVRAALGASRLRLARQFVTESVLLALGAGALGALLSSWGVGLLVGLNRSALPRADEIGVDARALLFTTALTFLTAVVLGLVPALRGSGGDVHAGLKEAGRGQSADAAGSRLRDALVVAQVALTLVLTVGAGLMARSFVRLLQIDPGFRPESAVVMNVSFPSPSDEGRKQRLALLHRQLTERIAGVPGVVAAGGVNSLPLASGGSMGTFHLENQPEVTGTAEYRVVTPGYFEAMGIPLLRGRAIEPADGPDAPHVAVISQSLAGRMWPGEDPAGKLIQFGNMDGDKRPLRVVGVVGDVRERGLESEPARTVYAGSFQRPLHSNFSYVARARTDAASLVASMRGELQALDRDIPATFRTLEEVFNSSLDARRFSLVLFAVFACVALALAVTGVYGVMSYTVAQRTHEIGVRVALGAQRRDVLRLVIGRGLKLAAVGIAAGLMGAFLLARVVEGLLFGVSATDPVTFAAVSALLASVALLACLVPARRATRVDPMLVLRYE